MFVARVRAAFVLVGLEVVSCEAAFLLRLSDTVFETMDRGLQGVMPVSEGTCFAGTCFGGGLLEVMLVIFAEFLMGLLVLTAQLNERFAVRDFRSAALQLVLEVQDSVSFYSEIYQGTGCGCSGLCGLCECPFARQPT